MAFILICPRRLRLLQIFSDAVLPVFIMAGIGFIIARALKLDPWPLSRATMYVFSPALIFTKLAEAELSPGDVGDIVAYLAVWLPLMLAVTWLVARRLRLAGQENAAFTLSALFMNAVNYALPVALFAFGEAGLQRALLFLAPQAVLQATLAIFIASRGGLSTRQALGSILRIPAFYATTAGLVLNPFNVTLPAPADRSLAFLADAAIPCMVLVLGIQLSRAAFRADLKLAVAVSFLRLAVSPALAFGVTAVLGIGGLTQQVILVVAGMPTAVQTIIIATEFNARPQLVTSAVAVSTLASVATVTTLVWLAQRLG
ncbi:MAG: AEC family transporter [Dehalococcoidia bacterium]|nr:AEC family transporter [Dehalococcoidia bacterium]